MKTKRIIDETDDNCVKQSETLKSISGPQSGRVIIVVDLLRFPIITCIFNPRAIHTGLLLLLVIQNSVIVICVCC